MTAAIAIPVTTTSAAAGLIGASASVSASQTPATGEGFAAALAALLNGTIATAHPQTPHTPKTQLATTAATTTDVQTDATAVVVPVVPGLILTPIAQPQPQTEQTTPAAQINAQASQSSTLQILQAAQNASKADQTVTTEASDKATPTQTPPAAVPAQSFAALAAAATQTPAPTPTPATAKPQAKPAASKEVSAPARDPQGTNPNAGAPTTESKAEANTHLANAIQHALSNNGNGTGQTGSGKSDNATMQLPATASPVAVALHTANIDTTTATTSTPAAAQVAVPLDALAVHIARKFEGGESRFEIRLDPIELGKLDISVTVAEDGRVQAVIRAERPETLDMLQRDARVLEGQLRQTGLNVNSGSLNFSLGGGSNQRSAFAGGDQSFANTLNGTPEAEAAVTNTTTTIVNMRDGVDIRI